MDLIVKRMGKAAAAFGAETLGEQGAALKIERKGDVLLRGSLCRVEGRQLRARGCLLVPVPCVFGKVPGFARSRAGSPGLLLCAPGCAQAVPAPPRPGSALAVKYQRFGCESGCAGRGRNSGPEKWRGFSQGECVPDA